MSEILTKIKKLNFLRGRVSPNSLFAFRFSLFTFSLLLFTFGAAAQDQKEDLPDEIRGYKVHKAKITVSNSDPAENDKKDKSEAYVRLTEPQLVSTTLTGLTFELSAEIDALEYSGKVDFLTFKDFKVNGLDVEIEDYLNSFEFKKNQLVTLPKPVRIFVGSGQALKGVLGEASGSKEEWTVTGRVFVFGRFKKLGFDFKRVVPVDVNVKIKNPAKKEKILPKFPDILPSF